MVDKQSYMQQALQLARQALGRTAPNPAVGAVVVAGDRVVGEGFHPKAGEPHAEIFALRQAGEAARGATIYVTLEPCSHQGRTGPCSDALIAAGIKRVVVGCVDPNPQVAGQGIKRLQSAGIEVVCGICEEECRELIRPFAWHIQKGMPYTIYKAAMTFDGQIATASGDSRWVSGEESRLYVHRLRDRADAIMVGVETLLADDPQLTTRLPEGGRDPLRVIVDSRLRTPSSARVVTLSSRTATLIATTEQAAPERRRALEAAGCEILVLPQRDGRVDLMELWRELGRRDLQLLLLEGGRALAGAALRCGLINRLQLFLAPKLVGGSGQSGLFAGAGCELMRDALSLDPPRIERFGEDLLLTAEVKDVYRTD